MDKCERCEEVTRITVTSNGVYVCNDCWIDGDDKE
ncbi:hypothetical protein HWB91_gp28 [Bacillus phage vB_BboS-125]|uniref:Uncharacterized protein n=1 Tax=Bacillus phage vB_BboS-125 TaxID=2419618 RepID=A0A3G3BVW8_9CAUD|nr:hypothetical protein HWB91_gp28 [Bacillus phage vB_BboS-125]AYP68398.1 hypothetical protein BboS125_00028 [Bacillus phage vB_BboS-125]